MPSRLEPLLVALPADRRAHSIEVGRKVEGVSSRLAEHVRADSVTAAYLHDVGYAHVRTDFHPLDGALFLADRGFSATVCQLVAQHSGSLVEARLRGIPECDFEPFAINSEAVESALKVLTWADLTTGPTGLTVTLSERLGEVEERYGSGSVVVRALQAARSQLEVACDFVDGSVKGAV